MRLGRRKLGGSRFGEPETSTIIAPDDFQDDPTAYADARLPYTGGEETATVNLYPGLGGHGIVETIVRRESSGHYDIRLDNFGVLPYWRSASWTQTLNEADSLTFEYPANAIHAASLLRPNTVSLYNEFGELVQRFRLTDIIPTVRRDGNGVFVNVTARGLLSQFEEEWVTYYGPVRSVITNAVDEFMAYYYTVPGVSEEWDMLSKFPCMYGPKTLAIAIQMQIMFDKLWAWSESYTVGDATHAEIQRLVGLQHDFYWPCYITDPILVIYPTYLWQIIAWITEHNIGFTIPEHVANLLGEFQESSQAVACGEVYDPLDGTDVAVLFEGKPLMDCIRELFNLSGQKGQFTVTPGREFIWVERLGASGAVPIALGYNLQTLERRHDPSEYATKLYVYGAGMSEATRIVAVRTVGSAPYIVRRVTVDSITDQATLDAYADELITVVSTPALEYSINALDLESIGVGAPLTIGARALVTDTDLGISASVDVFSIRKSLDTPLPASYTLARRKKTLSNLFKSIADRIARIEQRDDTGRIEEAMASGEITGVARVDGAVTAGTERHGDFQIDPETGRLQYVDLTTGEVLWQELLRITPPTGGEQPGDLMVSVSGGTDPDTGLPAANTPDSAGLYYMDIPPGGPSTVRVRAWRKLGTVYDVDTVAALPDVTTVDDNAMGMVASNPGSGPYDVTSWATVREWRKLAWYPVLTYVVDTVSDLPDPNTVPANSLGVVGTPPADAGNYDIVEANVWTKLANDAEVVHRDPESFNKTPRDGDIKLDTSTGGQIAFYDADGPTDDGWAKVLPVYEAATSAGLPAAGMGLGIVTQDPNNGLYYTYGAVNRCRVRYLIMTGGVEEGRIVVFSPLKIKVPDIDNETCTITFTESYPTIPVDVPALVTVQTGHAGDYKEYVPGSGTVAYSDIALPAPISGGGYRAFSVILDTLGEEQEMNASELIRDGETIAFEGWIDITITQTPVWTKAGAGSFFITAATKATLDAKIADEGLVPPLLGYVTDTGRYYNLSGWGAWQCINFLE